MVINNPIEKKELHDLIEKLPKDKYKQAAKILWELSVPEEEPTEEEKEAIERGKKQIANGEFVTLDDLYKKIWDDEEDV